MTLRLQDKFFLFVKKLSFSIGHSAGSWLNLFKFSKSCASLTNSVKGLLIIFIKLLTQALSEGLRKFQNDVILSSKSRQRGSLIIFGPSKFCYSKKKSNFHPIL